MSTWHRPGLEPGILWSQSWVTTTIPWRNSFISISHWQAHVDNALSTFNSTLSLCHLSKKIYPTCLCAFSYRTFIATSINRVLLVVLSVQASGYRIDSKKQTSQVCTQDARMLDIKKISDYLIKVNSVVFHVCFLNIWRELTKALCTRNRQGH